MNVLLVEDEEMLASMYQTKFKKEGYQIEVAHDGEEGLAKAEAGTFDVILLDIILPKLDGFAVLKKLRESAQHKATPVLMLTNLGQEEDIKKGEELGANGYLVKANVTPTQVIAKVKELL
ncbi:MAG: response regulator [Parcubacteria group bacterium]|nr:response regulator [Parcubacteria group bacterium]